MNLNHRQRLILEKLAQEGELTVTSLAEALSVSRMTIHRDLDGLRQAGLVVKQHGRVAATAKLRGEDPSHCQMCGQAIRERCGFLLLTKAGKKEYLCCPHCGLLACGHRQDIWQTLAADFLHGHMITATQAYYLLQPDLTVCCSPSVFAFASQQEVSKFQKGFGGRIADFHTAVEFLSQSQTMV
ncbi:MAG: DeoR family transcriptional regulator [Anaerolineales bacterium]|nr:DeoR family transcriptional regulator [Anaerolineales bacterium]MCS7247820.1 DeoR family transcriptional regulator [Anaerolineales bacterium]MDW8161630.1 DeoR family transcriptional regulator [Anaerolineales bacterium]MDW8446087.1 DeoR family transcriptional regulator [Anaerolineales bacterium]